MSTALAALIKLALFGGAVVLLLHLLFPDGDRNRKP